MTAWQWAAIPFWITGGGMGVIALAAFVVAGLKDNVPQDKFNKVVAGSFSLMLGSGLLLLVAAKIAS